MPLEKVTALNPHTKFIPERLIDHNANTFYASKPGRTLQPWVQLELKHESVVNLVEIINRVSCCGNTMSDVEVRVGNDAVTKENPQGLSANKVCGEFAGPGKDGQVIRIECTKPITGKYVTIQIKDKSVKQMNIADVDVIGTFKGMNM